MIKPFNFVQTLRKLKIKFVTGVPDSLLKDICACIDEKFSKKKHIIATNEGSAVGLAIGHYLATKKPALVYMQNSGLGNSVNPTVSLADPKVYGIPIIFLIGWRGEPGLKDEPQHLKQGRTTKNQLKSIDLDFFTIDEIMLSKKYQFHPITLGDSRLRTETAGIVACHLINIINNYI